MSSFDGLMERAKKNYPGSFSRNINETSSSGSAQAAVAAPRRTVTTSSFDGLAERAKQNYPDSFRSESSVTNWVNRYNSVMQGVSEYDKKRNGGFTRDASGGFGKEIEALLSEYDKIKEYAWYYGFDNSREYADQLKQLRDSIGQINENFSQFEDEDDYNRYMAYWQDQEAKRIGPATSLVRGSTAIHPDYSQILGQTGFAKAAKSGWDMYLADQEAAAEDKKKTEEWLSRPHFGVSAMEMASMRLATDDTYKQPDQRWTQEQRDVFGALYGQDKKKAEQFAIDTNNAYNSVQQEQQRSDVAAFAEEHPVLSTAGSLFEGATGLGMADFLTSGIEKVARGTITQKGFVSPHQAAETATGTIAQNLNDQYGTISKNIPVLGGHGLGDAYQLMNSIITSATAANTVGPLGTDIVFFGNAAASAMDDARQRGATDEESLLMGLISGTAEAAGEHFSASHLLEMTDSKTIKKFFGSLFGQALEEGEEELFTSFVNNLADNYVMRDKSNFYQYVDDYMQSNPNATEEEAKKEAWKQMWSDMAFDGLGGFASGGVHTVGQIGGMKALNAIDNHQLKKNFGQYQNDILSSAAEIAPDNEAVKRAQETINAGKDLSGSQLRELLILTDTGKAEQNDTAKEQQAPPAAVVNSEESAVVGAENETTTEQVTLESLSQKYGQQAKAMEANYMEGQDLEEYDRAFQMAYDMGKAGVSAEYVRTSEATSYLSESQREIAYEIGAAAAANAATSQAGKNAAAANGKIGWHKGTVKGQGVKIADMSKAFNDPQRKAYKYLSNIAEVTGVDIVLYKSEVGPDGKYQDSTEGSFKWNEDTIYIDINAGLESYKDAESLAKYTMMRTFDHEFTHFIEKWNPEEYNNFRKTVFESMQQSGTNVEDLIDTMLAKSGGQLTYEQASREVIAEAMTDILPETSFVETLARKNQNVFQQLLSKLKEFLASLKKHFASMGTGTKEAKALKKQVGDTVSYMEDIVKKFDAIAVKAVENYQSTVAEDETVSKTEKTAPEKQVEEVPKEAKQEEPVAEPAAETVQEESSDDKDVPPKAETEEAKQELRKAVRMPIQGTNAEALLQGIKSKELSMESVTLIGSVDGFNDQQRRHLVSKLLEGVYTDSEVIKIDVPYDGKFEISNTPGNVAKVLENLKVRVNQEVMFDKKTISLITSYGNVLITEIDGQKYVGDGHVLIPATEAGAEYIKAEFNGREMALPPTTAKVFQRADRPLTEAPTEAKLGKTNVLIFHVDGKNLYFDKRLFEPLDGGQLFYAEMNGAGILKSVDAAGNVRGYLMGIKPGKDSKITEEKPSKLKSYQKKRGAAKPQESVATPVQSETKPQESGTPTQETVTKPAESGTQTPSEKLADRIVAEYLNQKKPLTAKELYALADVAFGGTQAEGAYNRKDAYDAMELAVNKHLLTAAREFNGNQKTAVDAVKYMQNLLELLPTQSVRTQEQQDFQQFSTPPNIAYLAAWAANINAQDCVLEPSAGIGGLAVFAKAWGAEVAVNEISGRRLEVLRAMGFDHLFNENAEQIDNILPENISPSVVIMNPPFSSTAGRTKNNKTSNAEKHIDQALMRLQDGGRLVAILGKGMNNADYYKYWDKLRKTYSIRANLSIDGNNYKKYGTTWGVQIVVIDKTGPQTGETVTGSYTDLTEVPSVLEGIRNDRSNVEKGSPASNGNPVGESVADGGNAGNPDTGHSGSSERTAGSAAQSKRKKNRKVADAVEGAADRTHAAAVAETGGEAPGSQDGGTNRTAGRADPGNGAYADGSAASNQHQPELPQQGLTEQEEVSDDGVYATFVLPDIPVKGSRKHPAVLVESAAMAAVSMPKATYVPKLPAEVVQNNLSDAQMVSVTYAGQAHEQKLPDGRRKGFFIGDGTGVGKGRQIAGIILDNFMQGRNKAVWISKNDDLYGDAVRDWTQTTGRSKEEVVSQGKFKPKDSITMKSGILFTSYGKLKMEKGGSRLDQIVQWVGKDFDGVIAFDEAHFMGNLYGKKGKFGKSKGSLTAKAGVELQRQLPNARIVYVSATAATEVDNLAYAERLGLWGQGTAFNNAQDFIAKIGSSGLAAMELVIRDMKAMGSYVARSISYNGVNYDTVEHTLDPMQVQIYDTMSRAWQKTMSNVQSALSTTGGKYNSAERQRAMGNFYSSMQRFYNQVLTSMAMPSVIADMRKELAAGHSCVMQIVNTNEAQQNKQLAEAKANGESLDNLDMTPREALIGYLNTSFPTQLFEEYTDDDGNLRSRPVLDSKGNPVQSKEAIRQRDALIAEVNQMSIPDGPLEMLFDAFGTEAVAENTGRSRRVVPKKQEDGSITRVEERRSLNHRTADVQAFQDGKKRILVFSDAGGTGKSYRADRSEKNQQLRIHYVLQPGWVASNAVQGFGRTHRSNEVTPPVYKLVTTNIKGQKRFTSTIARRLDQLGALTKGQRDTGSGMFGAKDNLETDLAKDSLREFYKRLGKNQIEGIDGMKTLDRLGLKQKFTDEYGAFKLNDVIARYISTFLNRILSLEVDEQNTVFDAFISIYEMELEAAIQAGTLDTGMENVKADKIEVVDDKVIREDKNSGAATHYIQAKTYTKPKIVTTVAEMSTLRSGFEGLYKTESGDVKAVFRIADKTTEWGAVQKQYRLVGPNQGAKNSVWGEATLKNKAKAIEKTDWQKEWDAEVAKVPEYNEDTLHMLTGALLPIWNSLPQEGSTKVKRLIAEDGSVYLGRVISKDMIDGVLRNFAIGRTMEVFTGQQVMDKAIKNGVRFQLTNDRVQIYRSRVSGEWRLEVFQPYNSWYLTKRYPGIIQERISYRDRFFIPVGESGIAILDKLLQDNPVRSSMEDVEEFRQRTNTLTDREVLAVAANELSMEGMSEAERNALTIFRDRLAKLDDLQDQRVELGRQYRQQQFGANVDRAAAAETLEKMHAMDARIQAANAKVLDVEEKTVLRDVLKKAREVVEQKQKEHDDEILKRWRDRRNNAAAIKKYRQRIQKDVNTITGWALNPSGKDILKHIPDALKETVIPFLTSIDFTSKRQLDGGKATQADKAFVERLENLRSILTPNVDTEQLYSEYDLPPNFLKKLDNFIKAAQSLTGSNDGTYLVNKMTSEELKNLADIVSNLKVLIANVNKFHANAMFQHVHEAGDSTISTLAAMKSDSGKNSGMKNFLFWEQIRPAYAFERFGEGGKAIYDGLRRGQAQLAFDANKIIEFADKAYSESEVKEWGKEVQEIELEDGGTIQLTTAAMMSFYELSKRKQALQHMLGGGIRAASFKQKGKTISDEGHLITLSDVDRIIGALTPRQKEVADNIQKFMEEQGGAWGNHVSVKRFGEKLFGEEHYFPINSDGRHLQATADEKGGVGLYSLLNMGFTKQLTEGAKNRIILYNIFDVFANHMASMAQYHAMALPVLDAVKWFNYQQKGEVQEQVNGKTVVRMEVEDSVRDQLARVFGSFEETRIGSGKKSFAEKFILNILRGYNGTEAQGSPMDSIGLKSLHTYNRAQVAYNLRVVIQQPLAVTRAAMLIDYASIIRGMKLNPAAVKKNIQEMQRYSGIAAWKALGFYDVNISRGLTSLIKHDEKVSDKITEVGMWGAEKADQLTWAGIWSACKAEVIRKQHISSKDANFYEAVTKLFEDVIYKTQVVDSILTKNEFMRDKGFLARAVGSFMSEPTTTASMLMNAYDQYHMDLQRGMSRQQAWKRNRRMIGRTAYVYGLGAVILAAAQAVADAFRDDDDYQEYDEKWVEAFGGNLLEELVPFNKLPLVSDLWEVGKELIATFTDLDLYGNAPQSVIMQWHDSLVKGVEIIHDKIAGEDTNYTWYAGAYKLLQAVSGITGLPMAAATREIVTTWNSIVGSMAPSLKIKTYDPGEMSNIKHAYQDGYLTTEEAYAELLGKGLVDNENEAYWMVQKWEAGGDNYSRYDAINQAVRSGAAITAEMAELTSHGYTEEEVISHIKSSVGQWYQDGEITKQQATNMLTKYTDLSAEEVTAAVNRWSSKVVTGTAFDDIKDSFMDGKMTQSRAVEMYVRYGGYTQQEATEKVATWAFVKQHPGCEGISWSAIENYQAYCESTGMDAEIFYDAWKYNYSTKADVDENGDAISGSRKVKVLRYINGLNLTYAQKDSLYYAFGWAQSTIHEAPWH